MVLVGAGDPAEGGNKAEVNTWGSLCGGVGVTGVLWAAARCGSDSRDAEEVMESAPQWGNSPVAPVTPAL